MTSADNPFAEPAARVMVFGHPGHELAVFGLIQRYRMPIVVLTDGGGADRTAESRAGFAAFGHLDAVTYLGYSESSFYEALLDADERHFIDVADNLRRVVASIAPAQLFCDAVEFYNPVHDITLPIVMHALRGRSETRVFEVPLVYQVLAEDERYEVQRFPPSHQAPRWQHALSREETTLKAHARDAIYLSLRRQLGPEFLHVPYAHLSREEYGDASDPLLPPAATGRCLRYEWRAGLLKKQGRIEKVITHADHWQPMAQALVRS